MLKIPEHLRPPIACRQNAIDKVWTTYRGDQILTLNLAERPMTISTRAR